MDATISTTATSTSPQTVDDSVTQTGSAAASAAVDTKCTAMDKCEMLHVDIDSHEEMLSDSPRDDAKTPSKIADSTPDWVLSTPAPCNDAPARTFVDPKKRRAALGMIACIADTELKSKLRHAIDTVKTPVKKLHDNWLHYIHMRHRCFAAHREEFADAAPNEHTSRVFFTVVLPLVARLQKLERAVEDTTTLPQHVVAQARSFVMWLKYVEVYLRRQHMTPTVVELNHLPGEVQLLINFAREKMSDVSADELREFIRDVVNVMWFTFKTADDVHDAIVSARLPLMADEFYGSIDDYLDEVDIAEDNAVAIAELSACEQPPSFDV